MDPNSACARPALPAKERAYRFERKYYLSEAEADVLKQRLAWLLRPDAHATGAYCISSLYFDDLHNTSFHQKQNGVLVRNKLRIRYYNSDFSFMRLEHKHKYGEMVSKESVPVSLEQYESIREGEYGFALRESSPLWRMFYARRMTVGLRPVVLVEYEREAFTYAPGNVRVTFDSRLRAAPPYGEGSLAALPETLVIMELKYNGFLPSVISGLLSAPGMTQTAVSKYVHCREALRQAHLCVI